MNGHELDKIFWAWSVPSQDHGKVITIENVRGFVQGVRGAIAEDASSVADAAGAYGKGYSAGKAFAQRHAAGASEHADAEEIAIFDNPNDPHLHPRLDATNPDIAEIRSALQSEFKPLFPEYASERADADTERGADGLTVEIRKHKVKSYAEGYRDGKAYERADAEKDAALDALKRAERFIVNGAEFGYIRMPDAPDPALDTLPAIRRAIAILAANGEKP